MTAERCFLNLKLLDAKELTGKPDFRQKAGEKGAVRLAEKHGGCGIFKGHGPLQRRRSGRAGKGSGIPRSLRFWILRRPAACGGQALEAKLPRTAELPFDSGPQDDVHLSSERRGARDLYERSAGRGPEKNAPGFCCMERRFRCRACRSGRSSPLWNGCPARPCGRWPWPCAGGGRGAGGEGAYFYRYGRHEGSAQAGGGRSGGNDSAGPGSVP